MAGSCVVCVLLKSALTDRSELSAHNIFLNKKIPVPSAQIPRTKKQSFDLAYGFFLNPPYALPVSALISPCQGMFSSAEITWIGDKKNSASVSLCESILPSHGVNVIAEIKEVHRIFAELFKIIDLEGNNKTFRFWEISQNDNEFQG